jgi:hypothetical protein
MRFLLLISIVFPGLISAQNIGINTSTPAAALDVQSSGNSSATMAVSVSNSGNDTLLVVRDNGNVGIGTTQPGVPLDIQTQNSVAARFSAPVEGQPAVNTNELVTLGQLQAVSAGSSGSAGVSSTATMWSTSSSPVAGNFHTAMVYCRNLTEGGFTDWYLPSISDYIKLISDTSIPLPTGFSTGLHWLRPETYTPISTGSLINIGFPVLNVNNADWSQNNAVTFLANSNTQNYLAFCVR